MATNQIWVSPNQGNGWRVHNPNKDRDSAHMRVKSEALDIAERIAKNQGLDTRVQRRDGTISEEGNTYPRSRDKYPPKG